MRPHPRPHPRLCVRALVGLLLTVAACDGGGEACAECVDEKCADLRAVCERDGGCACMARCLGEMGVGAAGACQQSCELDAPPGDYSALEACVAVACPDSDECSTPGDFEPAAGTGTGDDGRAQCMPDAGADPAPATMLDCSFGAPDSCTECQAEKCCDLLERCGADADCACLALCVGEQSLAGLDACFESCELTASPPGFVALAECVAVACPDGDECSTPSDFALPPEAAPASTAPPIDGGIGSGDLADCGFDLALDFDADGELLQLQSADGAVCARVERRNEGRGSLANTRWTLLSLRVGPVYEVAQIDDSLCWYSSHHNFSDWAHAWSGSRRYDLRLTQDGHGGGRRYTLFVSEQGPVDPEQCAPLADGVCPVGEPIELLPVRP